MSTLNELVLPPEESEILAGKDVFNDGETAFVWIEFYRDKEVGLYPSHYPITNSCFSDCRRIIPAPTLEEMLRKIEILSAPNTWEMWKSINFNVYTIRKYNLLGLSSVKEYSHTDPKLAAFALLLAEKETP